MLGTNKMGGKVGRATSGLSPKRARGSRRPPSINRAGRIRCAELEELLLSDRLAPSAAANCRCAASSLSSGELFRYLCLLSLLFLSMLLLPTMLMPVLEYLLHQAELPRLRYNAEAAALGCLPNATAARASLPALVGKRLHGALIL